MPPAAIFSRMRKPSMSGKRSVSSGFHSSMAGGGSARVDWALASTVVSAGILLAERAGTGATDTAGRGGAARTWIGDGDRPGEFTTGEGEAAGPALGGGVLAAIFRAIVSARSIRRS